MRLQEIALVSESLKKVTENTDLALSLFYNRVFALDPAICSVFPSDFDLHGRRFLEIFQQVVAGLHAPETIIPMVKELGLLHYSRGVQLKHYHTFGEGFLWTLAQLHQETYSEELAAAWAETYYLLAGLMKEGAAKPFR